MLVRCWALPNPLWELAIQPTERVTLNMRELIRHHLGFRLWVTA